MAKITQYPAKTVPSNNDEFVLHDPASGSTKKMTRGDLIGGAPLPANSVNTQAIADGAATDDKWRNGVAFRATPTGNTGDLGPTLHNSFTEVFDIGNNFSSGTFTAPVDGIYSFTVAHGVTDLQGRVYNRIEVNASTVAEGFAAGIGSNNDPIATCTRIVNLSAGDRVRAAYGAEVVRAIQYNPTFLGYLITRT